MTAAAANGGQVESYILGDQCPYFSFYKCPDGFSSNAQQGYANIGFIMYNSDIDITGVEDADWILFNKSGSVELSLNLDKVTLKAGDSITINCILMPWGSQESDYTLEDKNVPWSYYSEITEGLKGGVDVLTGEPFEVSDATVVAPKTALVIEYKK